MKRFIAVALSLILILPCLAVSTVDSRAADSGAGDPLALPDWIITEICPDTAGDGTIAGYSDGKDLFEYFEIYNASGKTLNLYDYCMTYCGDARTRDTFENTIYESTPFKAGNFLDGSDFVNNWTKDGYTCSDLSNVPVNPDTCMVEPGEVVVIWSLCCEPYLDLWNNGKGASMADFRAFWNIPADVKVIAWDGNSDTSRGGHEKNFNIKNTGTGTYGIALYSEAVQVANGADANSDNKNDYQYKIAYTECPELAAWATVDFGSIGYSLANASYNFVPDLTGIGADEWGYTQDARRMMLAETYAIPTPGELTPMQKMVLGVELDQGELIDFSTMYYPKLDGYDFSGFKINGTLYTVKQTFTAAAAGTYTLEFSYLSTTTGTTVPDGATTTPDDDTGNTTPITGWIAINSAADFAAMEPDGMYYLNADIAIRTTYMEPFTGTFDGKGHTVTITAPMFAEFDGVVRDLTIDGTELSGNENLAAFALFSKYMKAYNVINKVDITVTGAALDATGAVTTGTIAGGLVADTWADTDCMIYLRNCKNYGNISVATDSTTAGGSDPTTYAGGLVGYAEGINAKFCENYGDVTASCIQGQAGGIVGRAAKNAYITTANFAYCTINANIYGGLDAGGIVGCVGAANNNIYEPYTVDHCTVIGDISGGYRVGGFVGYAYCSTAARTYYIEITNSIFVGDIHVGRAATDYNGKDQYSFGSFFLGYGNSVNNAVQNCLAMGEIIANTGDNFRDPFKVFMGCSSADTPNMPIQNVYLCDNNTTEWYSYATAEKFATQRIKLDDFMLASNAITRCTAAEIKNGTILAKLNNNAGTEVFVQNIGTDEYPKFNPVFIAAQKKLDIPITISGASLWLSDNINVIYQAEVPEGATNVKMEFTFNGVTTTVTDYWVDDTTGRRCYAFKGLNPQKLGDNISAVLYATVNGTDYEYSLPIYSARQYCVNMLDKCKNDEKLVRLISDLLVYSAKVQQIQNYKTDALVTDGLTLYPSSFTGIDATYNKQATSGNVDPNVKYKSATLQLSNEIVMLLYIETSDPTPYTFEVTVNGRAVSFTADDLKYDGDSGLYYLEFRGIKATEYDSEVTATIKKGSAEIGQRVTYSVCTYIQKMHAGAEGDFAALLEAIFNYGVSAADYKTN